MRPKISAVVQTYNASKHLARVLEALAVFDEIVVVDMESSDDTESICRRCGARFISVPRGEHNIVEAYRNFAVHSASYEWVLVVDADEIVPRALAEYLYGEIERDPTPRAFLIPLKNYFMGHWMRCYYPAYILRFFKKEGSIWPTTIHSRPTHTGPEIFISSERVDLAMIHLANEDPTKLIAKMNTYTDGEAIRRKDNFKPIKLLYEPAFRFFKTYVLKGGFRDGWPGFIHAVHDGIYRFYTLVKIQQHRADYHDIDRDVKNSSKQ